METLVSCTIVCSCGLKVLIAYDPIAVKYFSPFGHFVTRGAAGWTCGEEGHHQDRTEDEVYEDLPEE